MPPAAGIVLAYAIGSFPTAYLAGRLVAGVDLRRVGSGNLGATNVQRTLGWRVAVLVLVVDVAKGLIPVLLLPSVTHAAVPAHWALAYGIAAIAGHVRPVFLLGRGGGKGVATAAGVFLGLALVPTLIALGIFAAVVGVTRYVSLGSLLAALTLPVATLLARGVRAPVFVASAVVCAFVFWTHRANIGRLVQGRERRLGRHVAG